MQTMLRILIGLATTMLATGPAAASAVAETSPGPSTAETRSTVVDDSGTEPLEPGTIVQGKWIIVRANTANARQLRTDDGSVHWVVAMPVVHPGSTGSGAVPDGARVSALIPMPNRDARSRVDGISLSGDGLGKHDAPLFGGETDAGRGRGGWQDKAKEAAVAVAVGAGIAVAFVAVLYVVLLLTAGLAAIAEARAHRPTATIVHEFDIEDEAH